MEMTISQGLRRIAKLKGQIKEKTDRAQNSVVFETTTPPAFEFDTVLAEANKLREELITLETKLRCTNSSVTVSFHGRPIYLAEATCRLQELRGQLAWYKNLPVQPRATKEVTSYDYDDDGKRRKIILEFTCKLPEAERIRMMEQLQTEFDTLNDAVETVNNSTKLVG